MPHKKYRSYGKHKKTNKKLQKNEKQSSFIFDLDSQTDTDGETALFSLTLSFFAFLTEMTSSKSDWRKLCSVTLRGTDCTSQINRLHKSFLNISRAFLNPT